MEFNLKKDKPGWQKDYPVERLYKKYNPEGNLTNNEDIIPNHREKEDKELGSAVCVTN